MKYDPEYGANPVGVVALALILAGLIAGGRWLAHLPWAQWWHALTGG